MSIPADYAWQFTLIDDDRAPLRQSLFQSLEHYNRSHVGTSGYHPLGIAVGHGGTETDAGLWAHTANDWLVIELLYVPEAMRGQGLGRQLVARAEQTALSRGCHSAWLDTFAFQARGFYEALGYEVFGTLDDYPAGTARYFMRKRLQ